MSEVPKRIAVAGGWGYIGQKIVEAAHRLGLRIFVFDPSPMPDSMRSIPLEVVNDETRFYALPVDLYHLALHPRHRKFALERLLERPGPVPNPVVLCEKPMADPAEPDYGR